MDKQQETNDTRPQLRDEGALQKPLGQTGRNAMQGDAPAGASGDAKPLNDGNPYKERGDLIEGITVRSLSDRYDFTPHPSFDPKYHGIDMVYLGKGKQLLVVDAKCSKNGLHSLGKEQMQPEWIMDKARRMQETKDAQYSEGNAQVGRDIEKAGVNHIRRLVAITDPDTEDLQTTLYEGQPNRSWKVIDQWSSYDYDQPILDPEEPLSTDSDTPALYEL